MAYKAPIYPLTDACHHYTKLKQVPEHIQKYWHQRYRIFPYYDDGIYMTDDAWFGVTPLPVAETIAQDLPLPKGVPPESAVVVDMFAGAGGNTIAFALSGRWSRVIAIEKDASVLACAQNNAGVCGVPGAYADDGHVFGNDSIITWIHGDCFEVLRTLFSGPPHDPDDSYDSLLDVGSVVLDPRNTVLFASPPWGGVSYGQDPVFDLATMAPYGLQALHEACWPLPHALYLPRTSDLQQLADVADAEDGNDSAPIDVVHYCIKGASKALVAYYPANDAALAELAKKTPEIKQPDHIMTVGCS